MDYIRKLPLLMGLTGAIIVGTVGYANKVSDKENMLKMLIVMIIFYIVGRLIKDTVMSALEITSKKEEEKKKQLKHEKEKLKRSSAMRNINDPGKHLDINVSDELNINNDEEFDALPVADFIKRELR